MSSGLEGMCPPGHAMCCSCFACIPVEDLYTDENGEKWDLCWPCIPSVLGPDVVVTHLIVDYGVTFGCCGYSPFMVPSTHRMTTDPEKANCRGKHTRITLEMIQVEEPTDG